MDSPFVITVFGKDFAAKGVVRNPILCDFSPRFNGLGIGSITVALDDPVREFLDLDGARIRVDYLGEHLMSGPITADDFGFAAHENASYTFEDDWRLLRHVTAWVDPDGNLAPATLSDQAQSVPDGVPTAGTAAGAAHYQFPAGVDTAEAVVKNLIEVNANRLGLPVTVAPDLGRGGDARAAGMLPLVRFETLEDNLLPLLEWAGLGLRVWHDGVTDTLNVDVWEPGVWAQTLTPESGIITSGRGSRERLPRATRVVVGGPGEDNSRAFWGVADAALESQFGSVAEVFRDATGANLNWPDTLAEAYRVAKYYLLRPEVDAADQAFFESYLESAGANGLAEGSATSGLALTLSETKSFHFGGSDGIQLGDLVVAVSRGVEFQDRIRFCDLTLSRTSGVTVTPHVGDRSDDPDMQLAQSIAQLARAQRRLSTNK